MSNAINFEGKWATLNCATKTETENGIKRIINLRLFKIVSAEPHIEEYFMCYVSGNYDIKVELFSSIN